MLLQGSYLLEEKYIILLGKFGFNLFENDQIKESLLSLLLKFYKRTLSNFYMSVKNISINLYYIIFTQ